MFPGEQYQAPRSWTERAYPGLIYYSRAEDGGQFAALEQSQTFAQELRGASSRCVEPEDADGSRGPSSPPFRRGACKTGGNRTLTERACMAYAYQ